MMTQKEEIKPTHAVMTDQFAISQANSAEAFDPWEIQGSIDKYVEWELEYYEWLHYEGKEEDRPARPGRHPDPGHEWNKNPSGMLKIDEIDESDTDFDSDQCKSVRPTASRVFETESIRSKLSF